MSFIIAFFILAIVALIGSLFMAMRSAYGKPDNTPPAFPDQTDADIYRKL